MAAATSHLYRVALRRMSPLHPSRQCRASSTSGPDKTRPAKQAPRQESIPVPPTVAPLPIWQRLGPLTRAGEAYARSQRKRPYVTQVASALVVYFCADLSAQSMGGKDEHDLARTGRSLIIGAAAAIPRYEWFMFLARNFNYSSRLLSLGTKVLVNQLVFTPIFSTYFFSAQALLSGDGLAGAFERVCDTVPVSFVNAAKVWPAVTAFNFAFIPLEYRSIFGGIVAVGWQTYLSYLNRQAEKMEHMR